MGFWEGFSQGVTEHLSNAQGADKDRALLLLKGMIEGNVIPKEVVSKVTDTETQTPKVGMGRRILSGLGVTPSTEADISRYKIMPSMERETKIADIAYKTAQTEHLRETTPSYIAGQQADIENARKNIELRKQEIANDITKTAQQKEIENNRLFL